MEEPIALKGRQKLANKSGTREVGTEIRISEEEASLARVAEDEVSRLQKTLGQKRAEYLAFEAQILAAIQKASQEFSSVVTALARKHGIEVGASRAENWNFDAKAMTFVRTS